MKEVSKGFEKSNGKLSVTCSQPLDLGVIGKAQDASGLKLSCNSSRLLPRQLTGKQKRLNDKTQENNHEGERAGCLVKVVIPSSKKGSTAKACTHTCTSFRVSVEILNCSYSGVVIHGSTTIFEINQSLDRRSEAWPKITEMLL